MPHTPQHQFDPVAASAIAAVNASQRAQRQLSQTLGFPQPPGIETAFNQGRNVLMQGSAFAPGNVLASPSGPSLPGLGGGGGSQGLGGLPSPQTLIPGMGGPQQQSPLPSPQQLLPGQGGMMTDAQGRQRRPGSSQSGGSTKSQSDSSPRRKQSESRS